MTLNRITLNSFVVYSSLSSYLVYPTYRKTMKSGLGEGRTTTTHTYKGECDQRVPQLKYVQLSQSLQLTFYDQYQQSKENKNNRKKIR